jgi:hypothetical protein
VRRRRDACFTETSRWPSRPRLGFYISFSGIVSFKNAESLRRWRDCAGRPPAGGDRCALPGAGAFPGQDQPAGLCPPRGRGGGCGPGRNPGGMAEATTQNFFRSSRTPDRHETSPVFRLLAGAPCRSIAAALVSLHLALPAGGVPRRSAQRAKLGDAGGRSSWPGAWTRIRPTRVATPC